MAAHLAALAPLLLAPWRQRDLDAPWSRRVCLALAVAGLATGTLLLHGTAARLMLVGCVLATAAFGVWIALVASLLQQNHPHAARLVPGHLRRLRQAALVGWLPLSALTGGLLWVATHAAVALPTMLLLAFTACVFMAWAQRMWPLYVVISFAPLLLPLYPRWAGAWAVLRDTWQAQPWALLALCVLVQGALLVWLFGSGDGAHRAAYRRRSRFTQAARDGVTGRRTGLAAFGRPGELIARPFDAVYNAWLRRVLASARPTPASVMARAEFVIHGPQHWLRQLLGASVAFAMVLLGFGIAFALVGSQVSLAWQSGGIGMGIGLASAGFNPVFALRNMLWHSRREQALLALLPGMPQGAAQTRAVIGRQLRHFLVAWVLTSLGMLALAHRAGQPLLLCLPLAALPVGVLTLVRAPAGMRAPRAWTALLPIAAFLLLSGAMWQLVDELALPLGPLAVPWLAASALLLAWRWRALGVGPAALPAGRLG